MIATTSGCTDDPAEPTATEGDTTTTTSSTSTTDVTPTTSTTLPGTTSEPTSSSTTDTSSSTTGPVGPCATLLCGTPAVCCGDGEVCLDKACVADCASGVRCGADDSICCGDGEVCLGDACTQPLGPCQDPSECADGQYCDPVLGQCLPLQDPATCDLTPGAIEPVLQWEWTDDQVTVTPMVADVDGDGAPDVVFTTTLGVDDLNFTIGELVVLDGATGTEKLRIADDPMAMQFGSHGRATVGLGDVDGDTIPDIVYVGREDMNKRSPVHAVDGMGNHLWTSHLEDNSPAVLQIANGAPVLVNLDDDPEAEVVFGAAILDHDGLLVWNQDNKGGLIGTPLNNGNPIYPGGLATAADLDGDGKPEIVTGRQAWKIEWTAGAPPTVTLSQLWQNLDPLNTGNDGWPAVADLDQDGKPEVVLTAWPRIRVINGQTGQLWCGVDPTDAACQMDADLRTQPIPITGGNLGGPPTIADFDGDGRPEVAITGGVQFAVYDFNRPGEEIVKPNGAPDPDPGAMYPRWQTQIQDNSSAATGSSAFDFQNDGAAEVLAQDECFARVFDGRTGDVLFEVMNSSGTIHEYPSIVDLDGDGKTELMITANLAVQQNVDDCLQDTPNFTPRKGVFVYRAKSDNWAPTRPLWPQFNYHVTNADDAGNPPLAETDNWTVPGLNNFRQAPGGALPANAPDVAVSLAAELDQCPRVLRLVATIHNHGTLGVAAGLDVGFYAGLNMAGTELGIVQTTEDLPPGGSTQVTLDVDGPPADMPADFFVKVDPGADDGAVYECAENNNTSALALAACP